MYGEGESLVYTDGEWGEYLKNNEILKKNVKEIIIPYSENIEEGETKQIDIVTSMEIENGEDIIGYQYLHGTNAEAGGFQIHGSIKKDGEKIIYDLTYTWNDIIDPNYQYSSDAVKARVAKMIPFAKPSDYQIHLSFNDVSIISDGESSGWLSENSCVGD